MINPPSAGSTAWMVDALCRTYVSSNAWFPEKDADPEMMAATRAAQDICQLCPVKQRCLDWALAGGEQFGIWGGTNFAVLKPIDLRRLRSERGIARSFDGRYKPCGTEAAYRRHQRNGERPCGLCVAQRATGRP